MFLKLPGKLSVFPDNIFWIGGNFFSWNPGRVGEPTTKQLCADCRIGFNSITSICLNTSRCQTRKICNQYLSFTGDNLAQVNSFSIFFIHTMSRWWMTISSRCKYACHMFQHPIITAPVWEYAVCSRMWLWSLPLLSLSLISNCENTMVPIKIRIQIKND